MGLIERIKSALGLGSAAPPSQPGTTAGNRPSPADDAGTSSEPEPATEVQHDDELASAQTVVESSEATENDSVDVTVEHDPDDGATADAAGSGTEADTTAEPDTADDEAAETESTSTEAADSGTDAPDTEAEDAVKGTDTADGGTDADLEDIKGIGPTYADRLRDAGVESVDALATADAAEVGDATGIGESRVQKWIDRAETY